MYAGIISNIKILQDKLSLTAIKNKKYFLFAQTWVQSYGELIFITFKLNVVCRNRK